MKKLLFIPLFTAVTMILTGCLKDKGFENGEYGINDPDTQPAGVGFPRALAAKYTVGIDLSATSQTVNNVVYVNLGSGSPAPNDIVITLALNPNLRIAYNTANGTNILALDPALFQVGLSVTIPAGQRNAQIPIIFPNTSTLDPNQSYGFGISIVSVTGNYIIASNLDDLFLEVSLKNKYDGVYELKGLHNRGADGTSPNYVFPFTTEVEMHTTGPASAAMFWPEGGDYGQPIGIGVGAVNWYGAAVSPNFAFDPTTDICIGVTGMPNNAVTLTMVTNDATTDPNPNGPIVNRFQPGPPKKMWLTYQYNNNNLRRFYDTLTYLHPR
jgi:hypothetical protein